MCRRAWPSLAFLPVPRLEADPDLHVLPRKAVVHPPLEALHLGDDRADPVGAGDGDLLARGHPGEQATRVAHRVDPLEGDAVRRAERPRHLAQVAIGPLPLPRVELLRVGHVDEDAEVRRRPVFDGGEERCERVEPTAVTEDAGHGGGG